MAQDAITPFERVEIVEPEPTPQPDRLADIEAALLDLAEAIL